MLKKFSLLLLLGILISSLSIAQDSLCTVPIGEKVYILHHVSPKQTLYSLSKRYNLTIDQLISSNPSAKDSIILPGEILKIPTRFKVSASEQPILNYRLVRIDTLVHVVTAGETLYRIKQHYKLSSLDSIVAWNKEKIDTIRPGQELIVGWIMDTIKVDEALIYKKVGSEKETNTEDKKEAPTDTIAEEPKQTVSDSLHKIMLSIKPYKETYLANDTIEGMIFQRQKGISTWLESSVNTPKGYYALHESIDKGTILKVRNLMNDEEVYVKVIGKLPDSEENKKVLMKLSNDAANYLGVLDKRFIAEINYYVKK